MIRFNLKKHGKLWQLILRAMKGSIFGYSGSNVQNMNFPQYTVFAKTRPMLPYVNSQRKSGKSYRISNLRKKLNKETF